MSWQRSATVVITRQRCSGWIPDKAARGRRRRCGTWLDPVLTAAGITAHPFCDDGPPLTPDMEDAVIAWVGGMTPAGVPGPDPWEQADARGRVLAAEAAAAESAGLAARLAEVDRLTRQGGVTGAQVHAELWPDGPPWERGMRLRPRPSGWPAGTVGEQVNGRRL